ncbi:fumarylacetoacetate hydrolase family protein [Armatimonas sp.]|uniref:fumarylacetoacetate hydrolase family protein n=1 Tax=Armatimonas sp. TaxID=1872638 RepID=UPI00286A2D2F|nr:fumarylacetoacetate hydrolase family protein [Armatimonas sp.]
MKFAWYWSKGPKIGVVVESEVVPLEDAFLSGDLEAVFGQDQALGRDFTFWDSWHPMEYPSLLELATKPVQTSQLQLFPAEREIKALPPLVGFSAFRDFYAFEAHVKNARKKRGLEMIPEWYDAPVFYFSNTACIVGDGAEIKKPAETRELDYELEWAVVIGHEGGDIAVADADSYIQGFTILNDWSMRDVQRHEMRVGLGPAKGKDFATSVGPYLVTPDELEDRVLSDRSRGKRYDLEMAVFVNGVQRGGGNTRDMNWTFAELIAAASRNTILKPGDLIGSGTVGTGCITEFTDGIWPWLEVGDSVRLEVERLGVLENRIV